MDSGADYHDDDADAARRRAAAEAEAEAQRIKSEIARRYRMICVDWGALQATIDRHNAGIADCQRQQQELAARGADCEAAARVFGFNLVAEMAALFDVSQNQASLGVVPQGPAEPPPLPASALPKGPTVKDLVLEVAQQAFPNPIKASAIRKELANRGIQTHDKTIGMTLYRWARDGRLRREGWKWYFVPTTDGTPSKPIPQAQSDAVH